MASSKRTTKRPTSKAKRSSKSGYDNSLILAAAVIVAGLIGWYTYGQSAGPADAGTALQAVRILPSTGAIKPNGTLALSAEAFRTGGARIPDGEAYFTDWKVIGVSGGKGTITPDAKTSSGHKATLKAASTAGLLNVMVTGHYLGQKVQGTAQIAINKSAPATTASTATQEIARIATTPLVGAVKAGGSKEFFAEAFDKDGKRIDGVKFTWKVLKVSGAHGTVGIDRSKNFYGAFGTFRAGFAKGYVYLIITGEHNGKTVQHQVPVVIQ